MVMETPKAQTIEQESEQKSVLFIKGTHDHEASTSNASVLPATNKAVPRKTHMPKPTVFKPEKMSTVQSTHITKRWIPKTVLRAQGYYQGTKHIWLPKAKPPISPTTLKPPKRNEDTIPREIPVKQTQYWCPKTPIKTKVTNEPNRPMLTKQTRNVWVPKHKQPLITTTEEYSSKVAKQLNKWFPHMKIWDTKINL